MVTFRSAQKRALTQEEPKIYTIAADDNELTWGMSINVLYIC